MDLREEKLLVEFGLTYLHCHTKFLKWYSCEFHLIAEV